MNRVELLSPAGSYDCFLAAMNAGADAVYLGLDRFGARAFSANLSADELKKALDIAHILDRRIYLTVNTLFKDSEIDELYDFLKDAYEYGLDAVIVQDVGAMSAIHRYFPDLPIHVSTQAAICAAEGANILKDLGVVRIVPARELSLSEIKSLKEKSGLEIECFIHGSMCYSYSGKCLMSSFIGGRSGNRGRCAQPCRLSYDNAYPLSLKDMCTIDMIPELIDAGISSFKIEGRMKSAAYVYGVTQIYRKYIDICLESQSALPDRSDKEKLISIYTRSGNCNGYYMRRNGKDMITPTSPSYSSDKEADADICRIPQTDIDIKANIVSGSGVYISAGNDRISVESFTDIVPEVAKNQALTKESAAKQLTKTGGTCFKVRSCEITCDDGLFLTNGSLNAIRRDILGKLYESITNSYKRTAPPRVVADLCIDSTDAAANSPLLKVSVCTKDQLYSALNTDADAVIIPFSMLLSDNIFGLYDFSGKGVFIRMPYIVRDDDKHGIMQIKKTLKDVINACEIKGIYVSNLESVSILHDIGYKGEIIGDIHLYSYNREAVAYYRQHGITRSVVPVELNMHELKSRGIHNEELIIYGRLPMMISANCICNTYNGCRPDSAGHMLYITDRKNKKLPVMCDCNVCTNVIYNSVRLDISDEKSLFDAIRPSFVRFDFTDESSDELCRIVSKYIKDRSDKGYTETGIISEHTKGHLRRGVD